MIRNAPAGHGAELVWFKSSYSDTSNPNDCVEVAAAPGTIHVRDSKNTQGPRFAVTAAAWTEFLQLVEEA
jgi:hypothetical protein